MGLRGLDGLSSQPFIPCLPLKAGKYTSLGQGPVDRLLSSSRAEPSGRQYGKTAQARTPMYLSCGLMMPDLLLRSCQPRSKAGKLTCSKKFMAHAGLSTAV